MSKRTLFLELLQDAQHRGQRGLTTREIILAGCGSRFGARLLELRQEGHVIDVTPLNVDQGEYLYTYIEGPVSESCEDPTDGPTLQAPAPVIASYTPRSPVPENPGQAAPSSLFDVEPYRASTSPYEEQAA